MQQSPKLFYFLFLFCFLPALNTQFKSTAVENVSVSQSIEFAGFVAPQQLFADEGQLLHHLDYVRDENDRLDGQNIVIGVGEIGNVSDHIDIPRNIIQADQATPYHEHSDHVVGIIAGKGNMNQSYRGIVPESQLVLARTFDIIANAPEYIDQYGMTLTNNSYGPGFDCATTGQVNVFTDRIDQLAIDYPDVLHIFAAGNYGDQSCTNTIDGYHNLSPFYASAKNIITIGSTDSEGIISFNSSRGPTFDGRIKPELCAKGVSTYSVAGKKGYVTKSGTSIATPVVTGATAILINKYKALNNNALPPAGLLKAVLCNSADDAGLPGPDFKYGFGRLNARRAVEALEKRKYIIDSIEAFEEKQIALNIPEGTSQVKVMLYWNDPVKNNSTVPQLVNDLDLFIPDGTQIIRPLVAGVQSPGTAAQPSIDKINNIEQLTFVPTKSNYSIRIKANDIQNKQRFFVTYEFIQPELILTYPRGKEVLKPGHTARIVWDCEVSNIETFELSYSNDSGNSWQIVKSNIPATTRSYSWSVPNDFTENGKIKIIKSSCSFTDSNDAPFSILPQITQFDTQYDCQGQLMVSWSAISNMVAYEVLAEINGQMQVVGDTPTNSWITTQFDENDRLWISVRPVTKLGNKGIRTVAESFFLQSPESPIIFVDTESTSGGDDNGQAFVEVDGGRDPFTYEWSSTSAIGDIATDLPAGEHSVTVTDQMGCTASTIFIIDANTSIDEPLAKAAFEFSLSANPVVGPLSINWQPFNQGDLQCMITSMDGRVITQRQCNTNQGQIEFDLSDLPSAQYVVTCSWGKTVASRLFVVAQ